MVARLWPPCPSRNLLATRTANPAAAGVPTSSPADARSTAMMIAMIAPRRAKRNQINEAVISFRLDSRASLNN